MKARIIVTLMIVLSMCMVCAADSCIYEINEDIYDYTINANIEYNDAEPSSCDIYGTISIDDDVYNLDFDATGSTGYSGGEHYTDDAGVIHFTDGILVHADYSLDGLVYQSAEINNDEYYRYTEIGYIVNGPIVYQHIINEIDNVDKQYLHHELSFEEYSIYEYYEKDQSNKTNNTVDKSDKEKPENCMSSPSLGLGFKYQNGTVTQKGDHVPMLFTWAEVDDKNEHHTTLTFPAEGTYTGCVIITPSQIAGEPLVPSSFWDTPKSQRILQWRANAG